MSEAMERFEEAGSRLARAYVPALAVIVAMKRQEGVEMDSLAAVKAAVGGIVARFTTVDAKITGDEAAGLAPFLGPEFDPRPRHP